MSFCARVFLSNMSVRLVGFHHILYCCVLNFWLLDGLHDLAGIQSTQIFSLKAICRALGFFQ